MTILVELVTGSVADPGFPRGERQTQTGLR